MRRRAPSRTPRPSPLRLTRRVAVLCSYTLTTTVAAYALFGAQFLGYVRTIVAPGVLLMPASAEWIAAELNHNLLITGA